jgi:hypothetical protein
MTVDSVTKVASAGQTDQVDSEKSVFISLESLLGAN